MSACSDNGGSDSSDADPSDADVDDGDADADDGGVIDYEIVEPGEPWAECTDNDLHDEAIVVTAHDRAHQFWTGWEEGQNARIVDVDAEFPEAPEEGSWRRVFMRVELDCPDSGRCDFWDRGATISLVDEAGTDHEQPIELARHMTPYRVGMCFVADVTEFAHRLVGTQTIRSFIDTWVGPGHTQGEGWAVTTRFIFHPGARDNDSFAAQVIPIWNNAAEDRITEIGDPETTLADELPPRTLSIPASATKVGLRALVTGHGQGNQGNCSEFCHLHHVINVGGNEVSLDPWREDCAENPLTGQQGTWQHNRAGWCPGAWVPPTFVDITDHVMPGSDVIMEYSILTAAGTPYENACRPGAGGEENLCEQCVFNSEAGNCDWDWSMHTPPYHRISFQLLIFE